MPRSALKATSLAGPQPSCSSGFWLLLLILYTVGSGFLAFLQHRRENPTEEQIQARVKAAAVYQELQIGMSSQDVRSLLREKDWWIELIHDHLDAARSGGMIVDTPLELSELNWVILLEFKEDRLTEIQLGIADNTDIAPPDAELYLRSRQAGEWVPAQSPTPVTRPEETPQVYNRRPETSPERPTINTEQMPRVSVRSRPTESREAGAHPGMESSLRTTSGR